MCRHEKKALSMYRNFMFPAQHYSPHTSTSSGAGTSSGTDTGISTHKCTMFEDIGSLDLINQVGWSIIMMVSHVQIPLVLIANINEEKQKT